MSDPKSPVSRHGLGGGMAARQVEAPVDLEQVRTRRREDAKLLARIEALHLGTPQQADPIDQESAAQAACRWWWDRGEVQSLPIDRAYVDYVYHEGDSQRRTWLREVAAYLRKQLGGDR